MARVFITADFPTRLVHAPGVPVAVELQNIGPTSLLVALNQSDLSRVDAGGNPLSGQEITSAMGIVRRRSFRGSLWARTSVAHDVELLVWEV